MIKSLFPMPHMDFDVADLAAHVPFLAKLGLGIDYVETKPHRHTDPHKHEESDTYIYVLSGNGLIVVGSAQIEALPHRLIHIRAGMEHFVRTKEEPLSFLSLQNPSIIRPDGSIDYVET